MKAKWIFMIVTISALFIIMGCSDSDTSGAEGTSDGTTGEFLDGDVRLLAFSSAGGSGDIFSRELARILTTETDFDENIIVENRDGGSGAIAINQLLRAPADGHTILFHSSTAPLTMASGELEFTPDDLQPLASMVYDNLGIFVNADSPYETLDDLIQDAKENPGDVNIVSSQTFGINHLFALSFIEAADIDLNYIAYGGSGEAMTRLLGGNADALAGSVDVANSQLQSGDVRILATTGSERREDYPDSPTFKELGFDSLEDLVIWRGLFIHPDTPVEIQEKWHYYLEEVTKTEEFKKYTETTKQEIYFNSGEAFEEIFQNDYELALDTFENLK